MFYQRQRIVNGDNILYDTNDHISLYTNEIMIARNKKGICIVVLAIQIFLIFMYMSISPTTFAFKHNNNHKLYYNLNSTICNITHLMDLYKFRIINNTKCNETKYSMTNMDDTRHQQSRMYLFGIALFCICISMCFITIISVWIILKKDKYRFYRKQWDHKLDKCLKYEYIMNKWMRECNIIDLCDDIDHLIFVYTNCMKPNNDILEFEQEGSFTNNW